MNKSIVYNTIKRTVLSHLPGARIWLFGSRARGQDDKYSDYDLLIITPKGFTQKEKINWYSLLDKAIVEAIHAPVDLLLYSEEEVQLKKELPGHIVRSAMREGIAI
jgi:predicted nucleotidyltransferase